MDGDTGQLGKFTTIGYNFKNQLAMAIESVEDTHFETLCEMEQNLRTTYEEAQRTLQTLEKLTDEQSTDSELLSLIDKLSENYNDLVGSSVDLRYSKFKNKESEVRCAAKVRSSNAAAVARATSTSAQAESSVIREYTTYMETLNRDSLEYINLLNRLAIDLVKQVDISDPDVVEFIIDNWEPPAELKSILEQMSDPNSDLTSAREQLQDYLNSIKLSRARYYLENKYILQDTLKTLSKEVNNWRRELANIEALLFGNGPNSMRRTLSNVEALRSNLVREQEQIEKEILQE